MKRRVVKLSRFISDTNGHLVGLMLVFYFGVLALDGKLGLQMPGKEPNWFWDFQGIPNWLCLVIVVYGFRMILLNERFEYWLLQKVKGFIRKLRNQGNIDIYKRVREEERR